MSGCFLGSAETVAAGRRPLGRLFQARGAREYQMKQFSCQKRRGGHRSLEVRERPYLCLSPWQVITTTPSLAPLGRCAPYANKRSRALIAKLVKGTTLAQMIHGRGQSKVAKWSQKRKGRKVTRRAFFVDLTSHVPRGTRIERGAFLGCRGHARDEPVGGSGSGGVAPCGDIAAPVLCCERVNDLPVVCPIEPF